MKALEFDPMHSVDVLSQSRLLGGIDIGTILENLRDCQLREFELGEILLSPTQPNDQIHIVLSGELWVCLEPGGANPLLRLGPGQCAGELSIIDSAAPSAYVFASQASQVLSISHPLLWRMVGEEQNIAVNLLQIIAQRMRGSNQLITESLAQQRYYRTKSETDQLTGLHNRAWFEDVFPKQLHLCERTQQPVSLLIVDIDHFKRVNDRYGHACGDEALRHVATLLLKNVRAMDLSARYGGEEMVVLMPGTSGLIALEVSERLREAIATNPMPLSEGGELALRISGGVAQWRRGMQLVDLIKEADQALYKAKAAGRNQIVVSNLVAGLQA